jgi:hypothetical protein
MKRKLLTKTPMCPRERLVIISYTTGLSFTLERIGPLAAIVITVFYLLVLYLFALPNTPENPFANIYSESLIIWLVFLFFFFFFFFFFFSSFFSLASLVRRRGKEVRRKVSQGLKMLQKHSRGIALNPPPRAWEGRGRWRRFRRFAGRLLAMGSPRLGPPAGAFIVELGAALCLQAGQAPLLLQVSRVRRIGISLGGLVRQGRFIVGGVRKYHGTLRTPPAGHPLARFGAIVIKIFRGLGPRSPRRQVMFRAGRRCARKRAGRDAVSKEWTPSVELQDPGRDAASLPSAQVVDWQGRARDCWDGSRREESSYYLLSGVGVELADVKPEVVSSPVRLDASAVVLKRGNASGDELHSNHGPRDAGLPEVTDLWAERLKGLFGKGLACPGGELGGRHSGDEEELRFFEDVDKEPAAPKVFNFLHPLQVDEVALCSGGGDEGDAA